MAANLWAGDDDAAAAAGVYGLGSFRDVFISEAELTKAREKLDADEVLDPAAVFAKLRTDLDSWQTAAMTLEHLPPALVELRRVTFSCNFVRLAVGTAAFARDTLRIKGMWHPPEPALQEPVCLVCPAAQLTDVRMKELDEGPVLLLTLDDRLHLQLFCGAGIDANDARVQLHKAIAAIRTRPHAATASRSPEAPQQTVPSFDIPIAPQAPQAPQAQPAASLREAAVMMPAQPVMLLQPKTIPAMNVQAPMSRSPSSSPQSPPAATMSPGSGEKRGGKSVLRRKFFTARSSGAEEPSASSQALPAVDENAAPTHDAPDVLKEAWRRHQERIKDAEARLQADLARAYASFNRRQEESAQLYRLNCATAESSSSAVVAPLPPTRRILESSNVQSVASTPAPTAAPVTKVATVEPQECAICYAAEEDRVLDPCGHRLCGSCASRLTSFVCPWDRMPLQRIRNLVDGAIVREGAASVVAPAQTTIV